jgi:hypothetical protein
MMLMPFTCALLISPALVVELSIDRHVFPKGAEVWERIGLFTLKDGDKDRLVLLYFYDSDTVAEKALAREEPAPATYPNSFGVHAIYQAAPGRWVHREVFGYARVRFRKVVKVTPGCVTLECRPNFMVSIEAGEDGEKALRRAEEINKPFEKQVLFVDGVLTAR